jgi:hypothetical protein
VTSDSESVEELGEGAAEAGDDGSADPCGCAPQLPASPSEPGEAHEAGTESHETHEEGTAGVQMPTRELKLVVVLRPTGAGFEARIAAGAEGCDPQLRVANVPDLPSALAAVADLAAAAEARWRVQRRYPPVPRPASAARQRPSLVTPPRPDTSERSSDPTRESSTSAATPTSAGAGQLSLFG